MNDKENSQSSDDEFDNENFADFTDEDEENGVIGEDGQSLKAESDESTQADSKISKNIKNGKNIKKDTKKPIKKAQSKPRIIFNVSDTKYDVVKFVGKKIFKWKLAYDLESEWDVFWTDNAVQPEQLAKMQHFQKINHFPGMYSLARKNNLGRHLMRMRKAFPDSFKFFPPTWLLPAEFGDFKSQFSKKGNKTFIIKPAASCQGRGIYLTRTWENVATNEPLVAQRYLHKPYLIEGLKFDLRLYVLLAGCDPLKIFLFHDGLARFATEEYIAPQGDNLENVCMHLTNYAINKDNPNFVFNENADDADVGHKRSLISVFKLLEAEGHDVTALWAEIKQMLIKTFCSVQPILSHNYKSCQPEDPYNNMCFEVLGFDIMLDHKLKPWLIEVNHTPSFTTDTPLDRTIKKAVIRDTLKIMNVSVNNRVRFKNKRREELQKRVLTGKKAKFSVEEKQEISQKAQKERSVWERKHLGGYTKIYPIDNPDEITEPYEEFIKESHRWWEEWTGTAVKKNVKKVNTDKKDPPPFSFGQAGAPGSRAKDIQSIYSQKLKPTTQKPPSQAGPRRGGGTPSNTANSQSIPSQKEVDRNSSENSSKTLKYDPSLEQLNGKTTNDVTIENSHDEEVFQDSAPDDPLQQSHLNRLEENFVVVKNIIAHEQEKLHEMTSSQRESLLYKGADPKTTAFRIRTNNANVTQVPNARVSPTKQGAPNYRDYNDDDRFQYSKKFAHYLSPYEEQDSAGNPMMINAIMDHSASMKRSSPNKPGYPNPASRQPGAFQEEAKYGANIPGFIRPNVRLETKGFAPYREDSRSKKMASPLQINKIKNTGNYVQPKLLEFQADGFLRPDEDQLAQKAKSSQNYGKTKEPPVKVSAIVGANNNTSSLGSNLSYFQDSQVSIQKYHNFYKSKNTVGITKT